MLFVWLLCWYELDFAGLRTAVWEGIVRIVDGGTQSGWGTKINWTKTAHNSHAYTRAYIVHTRTHTHTHHCALMGCVLGLMKASAHPISTNSNSSNYFLPKFSFLWTWLLHTMKLEDLWFTVKTVSYFQQGVNSYRPSIHLKYVLFAVLSGSLSLTCFFCASDNYFFCVYRLTIATWYRCLLANLLCCFGKMWICNKLGDSKAFLFWFDFNLEF